MYQKEIIYIKPAAGDDFQSQLADCAATLARRLAPSQHSSIITLHRTVFLRAADNDDFTAKKRQLLQALSSLPERMPPPTTVVAQPPMGRLHLAMELEITTPSEQHIRIHYKTSASDHYIVVENNGYRELYAGGLTPERLTDDTEAMARHAFERMKRILAAEGMDFAQVIRQWNYIEHIVDTDAYGISTHDDAPEHHGNKQNYQIFNDVRSIYYGQCDFKDGYPAATGIGMNCGGIVLAFIAVAVTSPVKMIPIHNPRQVDAHRYGQHVLVGRAVNGLPQKTTPKFERAKALVQGDQFEIYISGTAAIEGQNTVSKQNVSAQTHVTMENIIQLTAPENLDKHNVCSQPHKVKYSSFRIYVKHEEHIPQVEKVCDEYFKSEPRLYVTADVCRNDLLVEIEGTACS